MFSLRAAQYVRTALLAAAVTGLSGCPALDAPTTPEDACARTCRARFRQCSRAECERGCNFVIDKLLEGEGERVLSCVAQGASCEDRFWARCAVRTGAFVDGGPPPPPPPREWDDEEPAKKDETRKNDDELL